MTETDATVGTEEAPRRPRWTTRELLSIIFSAIAVLISIIACIADWRSADTAVRELDETLKQANEVEKKLRIEEWQRVQVYNIIEAGTKDSISSGMSFKDINDKYVFASLVAADFEIPKEKLQELELKKILLDLMSYGLVYQGLDDEYLVQRASTNPRVDRLFLQDHATYAILSKLAKEPGKYTLLELSQTMLDELKLTNEEFSLIVTQLIAANAVLVSDEGKLHSVANPPPKRTPFGKQN